MRAITINGWWAWAIVYGPKRIENRTWATGYRGPLAIHCGRSRTWDAESAEFILRCGVELPAAAALEGMRGRVIGVCELAACWSMDASAPGRVRHDPWAFGPVCWELAGVRAIRPIACTGRQSLWSLPHEVRDWVRREMRGA